MGGRKSDEMQLMFKRTLDSSKNAVVFVSENNEVMHCNEAFYRIFGLTESECIGASFTSIADLIFGADVYKSALDSLGFNGNTQSGDTVKKEFFAFCTTKRGERIPVEASIVMLKSSAEECAEMIVTLSDITEYYINSEKLKSSEKNVEYLTKQLSDADRNKKNLVSTLSHEMRNPLASLTIGVALLEKYLSKNPEANKALRSVRRQLSSLTKMTEDMLDVARIEFKKYKISKEEINLCELISIIANDFQAQAIGKKISLTAKLCSEQFNIFADSDSINHMIVNLLNNALKFTPVGGSINVELYRDYESNEAVITVSDTGIGFLPDKPDRLFEPFAQEKTLSDGNDGLGLGFAIVKGIVDFHGGTVKAASEGVNKGASFIVRIPMNEKDAEPDTLKIAE